MKFLYEFSCFQKPFFFNDYQVGGCRSGCKIIIDTSAFLCSRRTPGVPFVLRSCMGVYHFRETDEY
jgi:hypothetical protein